MLTYPALVILYRKPLIILVKLLSFISQKGSHRKYKKDKKTVIVPHPKKEVPLGTFRSIVRQSGLSSDVFN
ncbi:MAG: type II toxin-antitoxin system HicA family toxin [Bacteroidetes bacterium]|nr:type II toxin-antitoxin system HicA family toxin [Bacteroidota bacterium]MBL7105947.1 type II toxin-antitoxin system HicA family toxin [Bacteroidales bacterium]